ncbi:glycosyltransferase family 1 protein [Chryseobacterium sp.]|uniref:glycosyltransferase family 4 protein n=1 Tax=Chryseobacterium sp. TaxID=1871047 RepID=UPI002637DB1A|nr:glycosyltransferase family 1 protein [Chryseobacterium sp.]
MKAKVILDADIIADFYKDNRTGIFRVALELFKRLGKNKEIDVYYSHFSLFNLETTTQEVDDFFQDNAIEIKGSNQRIRRSFLPFRKEKLFKKLYTKFKIFNFKNIDDEKLIESAKVFHSFYYPVHDKVKKYPNLKKIVTIHDLIPILFPELHFTSELIEKIIQSVGDTGYVICVSQNTKKDLLHYAPHINSDRVFVCLLAASPEVFYVCSDVEKFKIIQTKYKIPQKYFLCLGTLEPRKNVDHIIRSFLRMIKENTVNDLSLVLVGSMGWDYEKIFHEYENAEELKAKIVITGRVADDELASLYSNAHSFYYMSLYEGFGLPPLEAMQCGLATVTSNTSSLPEVVGDAGIALDPKDEKALVQTMKELYHDEDLRKHYAHKGLERSKQFSWEKCAKEHVKIYQKIINE